uniref:DC1 domain-containing protein n=1 Tax=Oryza glumipatula TaxID=40148 RepID=A0A0E0AV01_9ORYZ
MEEEPVAPPEMITHPSHQQHKLRLVTTTCDMPFRCDGCMEPGDGPRYRCDGCNFDMHTFCAKLPATLHHPMYAGRTFTFYAKPPAPSGRRNCDACGDPVRGFVYHCSGANLNLHPCCASLQGPITLDGHDFDVRAPRKCSLCKKEKGPDRELWCYHTNINGEGVYLHVACVKHLAGKRWQAGREKKHGGQIMLASEELMMKEGPLKSISSEQDRIVVGGVVRIIISVIFGDPTANKGDNAKVALSLQGLADLFSIQS